MQFSPRSSLASFSRLLDNIARPKWLAGCFVCCAFLTGLGCALLAPVGMFPDEFAHCARADGLRHGEIYGTKPPPGFPDFMIDEGVVIDNGILGVLFSKEFIDAFPDRPVNEADRRAAESLPWFAGQSYFPSQMVEYFPILYAPGALGLLAGESLGLTPLHTFYLGRVAMLLAFVVLGTAAIGLARFGNALIFGVLTLPTTVNLASSYSQDGLMIVCCALAAALLTRCRPGFSLGWFAALALFTAVVSAKTPYVGLMLFCLPPLLAGGRLAPGLWRRAGLILLACVPPGLWLLHTVHGGLFIPYQRSPYHPGPLWPGPRDILLHDVLPRYNVRVLLAHPGQIILLPLVSLAMHWPVTWRRMLGMVSCDTVLIWGWEYPCLAAALAAAALGNFAARPVAWRGADAGLALLALFAAFTGMEIAMYVTFTHAGQGWIEGVQARYFLPLLPFFIFILPYAGSVLARLPGARALPVLPPAWFCLPAMAMAAVNSYALPAYIFHLFQMPGP